MTTLSGRPRGLDLIIEDLNTENANVVTARFEVSVSNMIWAVVDRGQTSHATHVITLQRSLNGTNWDNTSHSQTGLGATENTFPAYFFRFKVTTGEGAASRVDIRVQGKP